MQTVPEISPSRNLIAKYATFAGLPGYAIRTADRRVFFIDSDAQCTQLTTADIPALVLLGDVNTAERQHVLDCLAGGAAAIACSRAN
jgi:hypothetical protein